MSFTVALINEQSKSNLYNKYFPIKVRMLSGFHLIELLELWKSDMVEDVEWEVDPNLLILAIMAGVLVQNSIYKLIEFSATNT